MKREVEAVFFWRYSKAAFAAVYGRLKSNKYSKDYLQSPNAQFPVIDRVLGRTGNAIIEIEHVWPGGSRSGQWRKSAVQDDERGQLSWLPTGSAPDPWKLGDPTTDQRITIAGNPSLVDEVSADAEFGRLQAAGTNPWILAIKLRDEVSTLHARAYLERPSPGLGGRGIGTLPKRLQDAIANLAANTGGGAVEFEAQPAPVSRAPELMKKITDSLSGDPNVLLIGPPGTGKTVVLEDLRDNFVAEAGRIYFDPDLWEDAWSEVAFDDRKALSLVFHPSYSYEDFVAGLIPSMEAEGFRLTARPGPLLSIAQWARESPDRQALLIIDEFNRGATASIFGDTLALLDADKRSVPNHPELGSSILRPYPHEDMDVESSFADYTGNTSVPRDIMLPASVSIVAALNSSDRSIAPLDAALRRRFAVIAVTPDYGSLAHKLGVKLPGSGEKFTPTDPDIANWSAADAKRLSIHLLMRLNERLAFIAGADLLLGHALLWPVDGNSVQELAESLAAAFDRRIVAALRLMFVDQDEALAAVLAADDAGSVDDAATVARWIEAPPGLQSVAVRRLEVTAQVGRPYTTVLRALWQIL